jgi:hypothetical protein
MKTGEYKEKNWQKDNKREETEDQGSGIWITSFHSLSYLMLAPQWYFNSSNLSSQTLLMSSLVFLCLFSHYRPVLLPHYEPLPLWASVEYDQTISNDVAQDSPQLMSPLISTYVIVPDTVSSCVAKNPS